MTNLFMALLGLAILILIPTFGLASSIYVTIRAARQKKLLAFAAGLVGWFIFQFIYFTLLVYFKLPLPFIIASLPISLFLAALFFMLRKPGIASGIYTAIVWNGVSLLVCTSLLAGLDSDGMLLLTVFPPFFWYLYQYLVVWR